MGASTNDVIICSAAAGVSLSLLLVGCGVNKNWWLCLQFLPFVFIPIPIAFCGIVDDDIGYSDGPDLFRAFGWFMTGITLITLFGIPLVMLHVGTISLGLFMWGLASTICGIFAWIWAIKPSSEEY